MHLDEDHRKNIGKSDDDDEKDDDETALGVAGKNPLEAEEEVKGDETGGD